MVCSYIILSLLSGHVSFWFSFYCCQPFLSGLAVDPGWDGILHASHARSLVDNTGFWFLPGARLRDKRAKIPAMRCLIGFVLSFTFFLFLYRLSLFSRFSGKAPSIQYCKKFRAWFTEVDRVSFYYHKQGSGAFSMSRYLWVPACSHRPVGVRLPFLCLTWSPCAGGRTIRVSPVWFISLITQLRQYFLYLPDDAQTVKRVLGMYVVLHTGRGIRIILSSR